MSFSGLPLISDLFQTNKCKTKNDSPCTCKFHDKKVIKPPAIDNRLQNWQKWMKRRKEMHQKLGQLLQREPGSFLMNSAEELRTIRERKIAIDYLKIPEPDPQRGCPGFWKMPLELKDECGEETSCFGVLTKEDKCEIPIIEHVGTSKYIMEEKDILPRSRNSCVVWDQSTYVKEKLKADPQKMQLIDPWEPKFKNLYIKGLGLNKGLQEEAIMLQDDENTDSQKEATSDLTNFTEENVLKIEKNDTKEYSVMCLVINDLQVGPHLNISGTRKAYVIFDYDVTSKDVATEYLTIKNDGTVAIRFYWKSIEKPQFFKDVLPQKNPEVCFYFNKNEQLIIPGQTLLFPIWFQTENVGTYCEFWQFCTKPEVLPPNASLIVTLHAAATAGDIDGKINAIRERINKNVRERLIKESLSAVMTNIPYNKFKPTVYFYNKKEVFESINSKFDPLNRQPKYLYNKEVVRELQKFYKKVRRRYDPKCWNYSIVELEHLTIAKQRKEEQLKRSTEQKEAKHIQATGPKLATLDCNKNVFPSTSEKELSKPARSSEKLKKQAVSETISLTEQLEQVLAKLEHPAVEPVYEQNKYIQTYLILCSCFNKVSEEFDTLKDRLGIIYTTKYPRFLKNGASPLCQKPGRLVSETLYEVFEKPPLTEKFGTKDDKPPAEVIQDIPVEDSKRRYRTYYNIPDTPPPQSVKGGKKKGGKEKKGGKGKADKKGDKKDKKSDKKGKTPVEKPTPDSDEDDGYVINEQFDPYAKSHVTIKAAAEEDELEVENNIESNLDEVLPAIRRQYKYNMYVIMYNNLDKAVSDIVDMIEMQPKEHVPCAVIKEIEEPNYNRRLIDLKGLLVQEKVDKLKAKLILHNYRKNCKLDWKAAEIQKRLKKTTSESSLWSLLKSYEVKPKFTEDKPISYPIDHFEQSGKTMTKLSEASTESVIEEVSKKREPIMANVSTSTLDGRLDPNWEDFKDIGVQKNYEEEDATEDLEAYVEKIISETSVAELFDIKLNKATQKGFDEYLSDEEYFFDFDSNTSSIESEQSENSDYQDDVCNHEEEDSS